MSSTSVHGGVCGGGEVGSREGGDGPSAAFVESLEPSSNSTIFRPRKHIKIKDYRVAAE